ncbi:MAG TPA: hypothetical protein VGE02_11225 [Gemmatimonadales bacterium]
MTARAPFPTIRIPLSFIAAPLLVVTLAACGGAADDTPSDTLSTQTLPAPATVGPGDSAAVGVGATGGAMLDPDAASREQLVAIPGMTSEAADSLVAGRPYASMVAVDSALSPRLGEAARDSVYAVMWRPIDLNTASRDEILLIPGVGDRMLREFEEYRPYTSMEQFRREIGKYVDDEELARLERYVTIR